MKGLSGIIIHDKSSNKYTAFVHEYPEVMAQANSEDEVKKKLDIALEKFIIYMMRKRRNDFSFLTI